MVLFADYEGIGVAFGLFVWLVLMIPASLLGFTGIVVGALRNPWRKLARWLGVSACLIELACIAIVWRAYQEERASLGAFAERYRPGWMFWAISALIIAGGALALLLSARDAEQSPGTENQPGEGAKTDIHDFGG